MATGENTKVALLITEVVAVAVICVRSRTQKRLGKVRPPFCPGPLYRGRGTPVRVHCAASLSGSAAFVTIRQAAAEGTPLPAGWALDAQGRETMDAAEALRGALLPFAGHKGANQALMVEVLAGLAGGLWSLDAPPFLGGSTSPSIGLFVLAIDPEFTTPGFAERLRAHLERLERDHGCTSRGGAALKPAMTASSRSTTSCGSG